jgi:hypothetical protein
MDRAEAIEILSERVSIGGTVEQNCMIGFGVNVDRLDDALDMAIAALREQEQSKWISVKERLPEAVSTHKEYKTTVTSSSRVLCVCVQKSGKRMVKEGFCEWYGNNPKAYWKIPGTIDAVTHWMPLPKPPKEGADHE